MSKELKKLSEFYKIMGDETRLKIINEISDKELCVCDIAANLDMTQSAISHQLKTLRQADLVKTRKEGKCIYYSLADKHVTIIYNYGLEHIKESKEDE